MSATLEVLNEQITKLESQPELDEQAKLQLVALREQRTQALNVLTNKSQLLKGGAENSDKQLLKG